MCFSEQMFYRKQPLGAPDKGPIREQPIRSLHEAFHTVRVTQLEENYQWCQPWKRLLRDQIKQEF